MTVLTGYETNPALRVLYRWFFDHIQVDDEWVRQVRALSQRARIVYVLRSSNAVDYLALDHLTKRFDLPRIQYVNDFGIGLGLFEPVRRGLAPVVMRFLQRPVGEQLGAALGGSGSVALFMKRPPGVIDLAVGGAHGRGQISSDEHLRCLLELQRQEPERPIVLLPQVFVWTNRPDTQGTQWLDLVIGSREWPSTLRTMGQFLSNYRHVELRVGEPYDLAAYLEGSSDVPEDVHVRRVMYAVLRRLERERRSATGPAHNPPDRQRLRVLRSPHLQSVVTDMAGERSADRQALYRRAANMVKAMQATPNSATIRVLDVLLDRVFHRIYAGLEVDTDGLKQLRALTKVGPVVLLPSHKSHVDYLVLSFIMFENNLPLPMIAAGDNLSFFPLGPVLRRAGGFFIRRSFGGDKLYSAAVESYVRRLLREGHTLELFLEGGRSRTGKLLEPKFGLLGMIVDAAIGVEKPVHFVPVSIGYERIVETSSYGHELSGGDKHKEDAAGLLKTTSVLQHRYGRITVQFAEPLTLQQVRTELGLTPMGSLNEPARRMLVTRLANRTMDAINQVTAVTPGGLAALAILSSQRRSVAHEELMERCAKLLGVLQTMKARIPGRTLERGVLRVEAIQEAIQMFVDAGMLEAHTPEQARAPKERGSDRCGAGALYRVPENKRLELETSKNHIIHFLVERGLVALSVLHAPGEPVDTSTVHKRVLRLSKLFKHEFRFRSGAFDGIFEETLSTMLGSAELQQSRGLLQPGYGHDGWSGRIWLQTYASALKNFVEGYRVAARSLTLLLKGPLSDKDLVRRGLALGHRMYLAGDIALPEAVSKPLIQNALVAFREEGYLEQLPESKLALAQSFANAEAASTIEGRLTGFCEFAS
ncbi:MAG: 1-acyl-sn-glycerol-3-phosphate acyltransferase [Polyangiales bacterium]